jgi:hypothetical protein
MSHMDLETADLFMRVRADLRAVIRETKSGALCLYRRRGHVRLRAEALLGEMERAMREPLPVLDLEAEPTPEERAGIEARTAEARRAKFVMDARKAQRR